MGIRRSAMEIQEGLRIMRALADGVSPDTGQLLTANAVYQYAPVVRERFIARWGRWNTWQNGGSKRTLPDKRGEIVVSGRK
jgi:hypothetical protein